MPTRNSRRWLLFWSLLGLLLVVRTGVRDRGVITDHLEFGRRLVAGETLYAPHPEKEEQLRPLPVIGPAWPVTAPIVGAIYTAQFVRFGSNHRPLHPVYPPSFGLMTWPFTLVPERAARLLWGLLQVVSLAAIGIILSSWVRRLRPELTSRASWILLGTFLIAGRYVLRDTHGGGGNSINLALALSAFAIAERGRATLGGLLLGLSLATKPTTILFVPLFCACGRWRTATTALASAAGLFGLAVWIHGSTEPAEQWVRGSLAYGQLVDVGLKPKHGFPPFSWMNQSLRYAIQRWLGVTHGWHAHEVPGFFHGLGWSPETTMAISRLLGLAFLATTFAYAVKMRRDPIGRLHAFALTAATSLLASPISWKAHHVALLPAFLLLAVAAVRERGARALIAIYFFACVGGGGDLVGRAAKEWQQSLYLATFGTIAIWVWIVRRRITSPSS